MIDLKRARKNKQYTLQHMGDALGVSRERYRQMEDKPERIRLDQLRVICNELDIDPDALFAKKRKFN